MTTINQLRWSAGVVNEQLKRSGSELVYFVNDAREQTGKIVLYTEQYGHEHSFKTPKECAMFLRGMLAGIYNTRPNANFMRDPATSRVLDDDAAELQRRRQLVETAYAKANEEASQ